ncbi:ornithine cyclodeaminase [Flavobacteriaceae bacterium UJ101]|nr:ornithine cyclodeaminase [Flavobacteriaceae bacterium UJ101]
MKNILMLDCQFIEQNTHFNKLIETLRDAFSSNTVQVPLRHHHDFQNSKEQIPSTLLLMPAWNPNQEAGVKIVTVNPQNTQYNLPSIQGLYVYLDAQNGSVKAILDAKTLTVKRTAAASALASSYLSKKDASSLLMIGTGALSTHLIEAHASVRPIKKVYIYGRNYQKAQQISSLLKNKTYQVIPVKTIEEKISTVDIISSATLSNDPLILGKHLQKGQHLDLVGSYKRDMREADDKAIVQATVYVDSYEGALKESGDIVIPLEKGLLKVDEIPADLFKLCSQNIFARKSNSEITLFKSVGHALEDLTAATYYYNQYTS